MSKTRQKPAKPRKDYPFFPNGNGQRAKKSLGKQYYFGPWDDPVAAKSKYLADREYLQAERKPPQVSYAGSVQSVPDLEGVTNALRGARHAIIPRLPQGM